MTLKVCKAFKDIEEYLPDNFSFEKNHTDTEIYNAYCPISKETGKGKCGTIGQVVSAVTTLLINNLITGDEYIESENENNEYITYIILWLSDKMKLIKTWEYGSVSDFDTTFIKDGEYYKEHIDQIKKKENIMNVKIDEMHELYELLNDLCNVITKYTNDSSNCSDCSNFTSNWEEKSNKLVNKKIKVFEDEYYCDVLLTLKNAYEKFKRDNNIQNKLPKIKEIEEINNCKKLCKEATKSWRIKSVDFQQIKEKKNIEKSKDNSRYIDVAKNKFETYSSFFSIIFTNIGNNLYEKVFPALTNVYGKFINFTDNTISYVNEQLKKAIEAYTFNNDVPEETDPGGDQLSSQETPSEASSPSSSTKQTRTSELPQKSSEKKNYDQKNEEGSKKTMPSLVIKHENSVTEVKLNGATGIDDNPLNLYKKIGISIIMLLIPIALAIMYKYFPFGWRKELKKKKNMKKVINMFGVNEATKRVINPTNRKNKVQIIINLSKKKQDKKFTNSSTQKKQDKKFTYSSTQKKQNKQFINSIYWEKYPLLNIYKLMEADAVPFIILYLLFIFYVYKRKDDSLE
ncbi:BIR protein [Plasmodium berghei]|uniref:BIR protein n=2 Tax=Plasmodium berghei TaxID=5821 RepID=A0A509AEF8_PLABA|nr:BIR protein [Plasmodium berghei ANKA]SBW38341.1 BIR protein [Plasmodium berghei]SCL84126.1 BIR protein [Plasmodium berghei]SCL86626.1 BIR protein [Plasmodium berghei]SCL86853.1 BIR protein [Plasmodium berghei]VUC54029.1 BIR protein [Plasmodium berghei ANKA]|eukprot:XP_034419879.1 BIR protein [Plasmodium berghei ANKA]